MSFTGRELKLLWGPAPNACAFPTCRQPLIEDGVVIGEMAHINGDKDGSNRYDETIAREAVDSIDNRILLCPTHHTKIDKAGCEDDYPPELLRQWKRDQLNSDTSSISDEQLAAVIEQLAKPRIHQVAINSPGAIQAAGDVTITHNPLPALQLLHADGAPAVDPEVFGGSATLFFGAHPAGAIANVVIEITVEGFVDDFKTAIVGTGMVIDRTSSKPSVDAQRKILSWGQHLLDAGCAMRIELSSPRDLGRIRWQRLTT